MRGIRAVAVVLGVSAIVGVAAAAPAGAANCTTVKCLQKQVNKLSKTVKKDTKSLKQDTTDLKALSTCLYEAPITLYGDPSGTPSTGYEFSNDGAGGTNFLTQALSATPSGGEVSAWVLIDECNTATTASISRAASTRPISGARGPIAPIAPLLPSFPAS